MLWVVLTVVILVVALVGWLVSAYNRLVRLRNRAEEGWAGIDVQLQQRADLVPNLVETVKGYASHESEVFAQVTEARTAVQRASGPAESERASGMLDAALGRLFAVAEDYPELKASANFAALQAQLADIEEEIALARRYYNATVEDLNTGIETFPTNLVAGPFGFSRQPFFQAAPTATAVPQVEF